MNQQALSAGDLCTRSTVIADALLPLNEAARLMRAQHVGCLIVVARRDGGCHPVGIVTDRDIVIAAVAKDLDAATLRVEDIMSTDLATAQESDSALDAMAKMRSRGVQRLPVVDAQGQLQGILSREDLMELVEQELVAMVAASTRARGVEAQRRP